MEQSHPLLRARSAQVLRDLQSSAHLHQLQRDSEERNRGTEELQPQHGYSSDRAPKLPTLDFIIHFYLSEQPCAWPVAAQSPGAAEGCSAKRPGKRPPPSSGYYSMLCPVLSSTAYGGAWAKRAGGSSCNNRACTYRCTHTHTLVPGATYLHVICEATEP